MKNVDELEALHAVICNLERKIKAQGMITNARDEAHLLELKKIFWMQVNNNKTQEPTQ